MTESISKLRRALLAGAAALLLLGACAAPGQDPQVNVDGPAPSAAKTPEAANPPAVTEATITVPPKIDGGEQGEQAASAGDVSTWKQVTRTAGDVTYSYRYPSGWTADLSYCAPGAARIMTGGELPPRCASTDILVGQKAADVATIQGENISLNGKQAVKQINKEPRNGMASRIYTVVIYDAAGGPLMGFSTSIGPGTDDATQNNITAMLDQVAGTLTVGR